MDIIIEKSEVQQMKMDGHTHTQLCAHGSGEKTEKIIALRNMHRFRRVLKRHMKDQGKGMRLHRLVLISSKSILSMPNV